MVAVRALCEFTAKQGDLDLRFTPSPTAQEGIAGHALVAARRSANYESEISLNGEHGLLRVRGRADGYDPTLHRLEEIKTFRGDLGRMPENHRALHWAQARIYGWLMCRERGWTELTLALVYFDIASQQETVFTEVMTAAALEQFFVQQCARFLAWAEQELAHRQARDAAWSALVFPHPAFRTGQRELAQAVYQGVTSARCVLAQAPTGIGKTIGTLFPLLKAAPAQQLDKLFFLTAKTSGRSLALGAVALLKKTTPTLPLRVLELVARDKACEHPDKACHGDSCPLAKGFYDRLPQARAAAVRDGASGSVALRTVALEHAVCPYYLAQDLVRWSDLVIGDYNYYFDSSAMLYSMTLANQWRIAVLVDEAHNLIERGRKMYSAELDHGIFQRVRLLAPASVRKSIDKLSRCWTALLKEYAEPYQVLPALPDKFVNALQLCITNIGEFFSEYPTRIEVDLQRFYFDAIHFARMAEAFGDHSLCDISRQDGRDAVLCLRNVIPAPFLAPRFAATRSTTLFSATLSPWHFYSDTLGLPATTAWIDVASPFTAAQLTVRLVSTISTRFRQRADSVDPIIALMVRQYQERPGNYLTFFSSFDYLQAVTARLVALHPELPIWQQARRMDDAGREDFLARFAPGGRGIGFAVLGGSFGEGIDLPGDRLIGAFIATLGLPQMNPVNEQIMQRMQQRFGSGYDYTYLFPGLQKVVQAAGRVIRTPSDRGIVVLIDDRYPRPQIRALLPRWWQPE
ncbi:DinG family ATP-dependent helicase [Oxalobacteraceae bacterium IMCC9480]|nr:DinG family ATP-dependent helicase [Oxalobacteraceae bacterium IMCC9480]